MKPGKWCECGNHLGDCSVPMVVKPCQCLLPGDGKRARLSTTNKGCVRKSWDDVFADVERTDRNDHGKRLIAERAARRRAQGIRLI